MNNEQKKQITNIEIDLIIKAIYDRYHWDFSHYKKASLKRRIMITLQENEMTYISELLPKLLWDEQFFHTIVENISVPVSDMFRDPEAYLAIRNEVIPILRTYPYLKVWHAGCANGKEVYSMAILLAEEELAHRCELIGTDINQKALHQAKEGIYPYQEIKDYKHNYHTAGGKQHLLDYFHLTFENAVINNSLKKHLHFKYHNLFMSECLNNINMVVCRNVFIYFDKYLQNKAIELFLRCLKPGGFLWLGSKESIKYSEHADKFEVFNEKYSIYRKCYE